MIVSESTKVLAIKSRFNDSKLTKQKANRDKRYLLLKVNEVDLIAIIINTSRKNIGWMSIPGTIPTNGNRAKNNAVLSSLKKYTTHKHFCSFFPTSESK